MAGNIVLFAAIRSFFSPLGNNHLFARKYLNMSTQEARPQIEVNPATLDQGDRICRNSVKQCFSKYAWVVGNQPGEQKKSLNAILNLVVRAIDYLDLESADGLPLDVWCEFRDELSDAFQGNYSSEDLYCLVHAAKKHSIPRQYFFDMLNGIDFWIRNRGFETYDDLLVFAYQMGGAPLTASVPVLGFVKEGYEEAACSAGQAIFLTQVLANIVRDTKLNKMFIAKQDIVNTDLSIARLKVRKNSPELKHLVRLYGSRIEKLMYAGGKLVDYLDFDARRTFTSLLSVHWSMLIAMRLKPEVVLNPDGVLSRKEMFKLKTKHFMGTEGNIPVFPEIDHHHH